MTEPAHRAVPSPIQAHLETESAYSVVTLHSMSSLLVYVRAPIRDTWQSMFPPLHPCLGASTERHHSPSAKRFHVMYAPVLQEQGALSMQVDTFRPGAH